MKNLIIIIITTSILITAFISCGKKQTLIYNQPELTPEIGYYERAWVDPQLIYSDSLLTIIRSDRVDSFFVEKPQKNFNEKIITIAFEVKEQYCFTSILLLDVKGNLISVLVSDDLSIGQYKVSFNPSRINYVQPDASRFFLKTDFCGFSIVEEVSL